MGTPVKKIRRPRGLWLLTLALLGIWAVCTVNAFQLISNQAGKLQQAPITVVLDAGHGWEDGGASSADGALEKDLNLAIAQRLRPMLESSGFRVVMIRDSDISVGDEKLETVRERKVSDLHNRLHMVEAEGECILLSIHQNHFSEAQYHGTQIFYSPNVPESADLGRSGPGHSGFRQGPPAAGKQPGMQTRRQFHLPVVERPSTGSHCGMRLSIQPL